eukprot:SAG31_NODE_42948_length_269_cov_0.829412_1_plen_73_part_10
MRRLSHLARELAKLNLGTCYSCKFICSSTGSYLTVLDNPSETLLQVVENCWGCSYREVASQCSVVKAIVHHSN